MSELDRVPVDLPRNQWDQLAVPGLGTWSPSRTVSVVMPYYERSQELNLTLAALNEQSYPSHLIEVIVVDDGSRNDPPRPIGGLGFDLRIVTQADQGYGLARARNLGADLAQGSFLIFLDCDMIPEKQTIEAHSRWHHDHSGIASVGFRYHSDFTGIQPDQVAEAVRGEAMADLLAGRDVSRPEWIEAHLHRLENFLGDDDDFWRVMSGGNLGVDREMYLEVGGTDESFSRWGGEDNELGFRLLQAGAVVVPEKAATAWHQGDGQEPTEEDLVNLRIQKPKLESLIPDPGMRRLSPGRQFERPLVVVYVSGGSAEDACLAIDSVLGSDSRDVVVGVGAPESPSELEMLHNTFDADSRVVLGVTEDELFDRYRWSPVRVVFPGTHVVEPTALSVMEEMVGGAGPGLLHFTLPGVPPSDGMGKVTYARAFNRAKRLPEGPTDENMGRLFGERWVSGPSLGVWEIKDLDEARRLVLSRPRGQGDALVEARAIAEDLRNRRVLQFSNGLGMVARARSWQALGAGLRAIVRAVSPARSSASGQRG